MYIHSTFAQHIHVSTAHKPQILSSLRDLVLESCWQTPDIIFEMSQLQNAPYLLVTKLLERVQVHPQSSREEYWVLLESTCIFVFSIAGHSH